MRICIVVFVLLFGINFSYADYIALGQTGAKSWSLASVSENGVVSLIDASIPQATAGFYGAFCELTNEYFLISSPNYLLSYNTKTKQHKSMKLNLPNKYVVDSFCISRATGVLYTILRSHDSYTKFYATINPESGKAEQASALFGTNAWYMAAFNCIVDDNNSRIMFTGSFPASYNVVNLFVTQLTADNQGNSSFVSQDAASIGGLFNPHQKKQLFS